VYYLRHIGFLGATAPAVQGLRTPTFAGGEAGVLEFADWDDVDNASLWRNLRDWLLGKFGQADADTAVPGYLVGSLERAAQAEPDDNATTLGDGATPRPAFAQPEKTVTPQEKAALEAENAQLRQQITAAAATQRQARIDGARVEGLAFADGLLAETKIGADDRNAVAGLFVAVAERAAEGGKALMFARGEGDGATQAPLLPALKTLLQGLAPRVATGQHATAARAAGAGGAALEFAAPAGVQVNQESLGVHRRVKAYQLAHPGTEYESALAAVMAGAV